MNRASPTFRGSETLIAVTMSLKLFCKAPLLSVQPSLSTFSLVSAIVYCKKMKRGGATTRMRIHKRGVTADKRACACHLLSRGILKGGGGGGGGSGGIFFKKKGGGGGGGVQPLNYSKAISISKWGVQTRPPPWICPCPCYTGQCNHVLNNNNLISPTFLSCRHLVPAHQPTMQGHLQPLHQPFMQIHPAPAAHPPTMQASSSCRHKTPAHPPIWQAHIQPPHQLHLPKLSFVQLRSAAHPPTM